MEMSYKDKNFRRFVSDDRFISKGSFGDVYGPCEVDGKIFAIKKRWIKKEQLGDAEKQLLACGKWMSLHHKRLITVYDVSLEPHAVYVLMEFAGGGSLKMVLSERKSDFPLEILKDWGIQIAEGMAHLHENDIVHRDLKSPNILIMEAGASSNPYNKRLKITDFDQIREYDGTKTMTYAGTNAWAAPEVLADWKFSKASDVWSYGVVLWEILTRDVPYKDVSEQLITVKALNEQLKLEIPDSCPDIVRDFLNRCLSYNKDKRPSFYEILPELHRYRLMPEPISHQRDNTQLNFTIKGMKRIGDYCYDENTDNLGEGSFGAVYKGRHVQNPQKIAAIKTLNLQKSIFKHIPPEILDRENAILQDLSAHPHPNIISFLHYERSATTINIITEFCNGGDLGDYLKAERILDESTILRFFKQIASGIKFVHDRNIVHRNLKPENVLLCFTGDRYPALKDITLKIANFAVGRFLGHGAKAETMRGSFFYMAPEIRAFKPYDNRVDLWSVGVTMIQCLTGNLKGAPDFMKLESLLPTSTSQSLSNLLRSLLAHDPRERLDCDKFLNHAFFRETTSASVVESTLAPDEDYYSGTTEPKSRPSDGQTTCEIQ